MKTEISTRRGGLVRCESLMKSANAAHEWCLRRRFASTHLAGEWFQLTDELRAYVKAVAIK